MVKIGLAYQFAIKDGSYSIIVMMHFPATSKEPHPLGDSAFKAEDALIRLSSLWPTPARCREQSVAHCTSEGVIREKVTGEQPF
jgi:hypothetical protein